MNAAQTEARRWFKQAQADLAVVQTLRSAGHYAATCYPNGLPSPTIPDEAYTDIQAEMAQEATEHVLNTVETFLQRHTRVLD